MKNSDELRQLIATMSRQEKRYFKLYAGSYRRSSTGNKFTALFDAIDRSAADCQDEEIRCSLPHKPSPNQFASAKYDLQRQVLSSLASYHAGRSVAMELQSLLAQVEVLYNKGLYDHCRKVLQRARRKAEDFEKHGYLVEILGWERKLHLRSRREGFEEMLRHFHTRQLALLDALSATIRFEDMADRVQEAHRSYVRMQNAAALQNMRSLMDSGLSKAELGGLPFRARLAVIQARANYAWFQGNREEAMQHYREAIAFWESRPQHIQDDPDNYKRYLSNYLSSAMALRSFDDFAVTLQKIKGLPSASIEAATSFFALVSYLELTYYLNDGLLPEALAVADAFEQDIGRYEKRMRPDRLINLYYNCSIICFLSGEFGRALEHINEIMNERRSEPKRDIQDFARIFSLVIHYELQNFETVESLLRSARRYLQNRSQYNEFARSVINGISRLVDAAGPQEQRAILQKLRTSLVEHLENPGTKETLGLLEFLFWLESRLSGTPIKDVYIAKMQSRHERDARVLFAG